MEAAAAAMRAALVCIVADSVLGKQPSIDKRRKEAPIIIVCIRGEAIEEDGSTGDGECRRTRGCGH